MELKKNKIFSILLSVVIALGLWAYVVSTVATEDTRWINNIPVTFANEDGLFADRHLTLTEGRNATVNLKFRGNRQELMKLSNSNVAVIADLSEVTDLGTWRLGYDVELPDNVKASAISVDSRSVYQVEILVDKLSTKEVPVRATFQGDVESGYVAEAIELENDTIDISGPQELVSSVSYAQVTLERTNLSKTVSDSLSYTLMDEDNNPVVSDEIRCEVDKIGVLMQVNMVKEIPLVVAYSEGGGATLDHTIETIEPSTITVKGPAEELETLNSLTLGTIDLASVHTVYTQDFNIVVPNGMVNLTEDVATVTVELVNLKEKTFRVTNLELASTPDPEQLRATLGTLSIQVKLRGDAEVIDSISASDIRAVADLSSLGSTTGQFSVPVEIYVDGFSGVGAMGTYSVLVSISEPADAETMVEVSIAPDGIETGESQIAGTEDAYREEEKQE